MKARHSFWDGFRVALSGMGYLFRTQHHARIHLAIILAVVALGLWLTLPAAHWALLVLTFCLVLGLEACNSAIEALGDAVTLDQHPLIGAAKDVAASAVLMAAMGSVIIGLLILGPPLWQRLIE